MLQHESICTILKYFNVTRKGVLPLSNITAHIYRALKFFEHKELPYYADNLDIPPEIIVTFTGRQIENSKRNGWRHLIFSPGRKYYKSHYRGQWENDKKEGRGTETHRNGSMYEGEWVNNQRHGYGILKKISEDGCLRECYVGNWVRGKKHGFGCNLYGDGSYYEGAFYQNKRQRYGCMWYANGSYYEGIWKNDRFNGAGTFIQANGNRYEGEFVEGKKEGRGTFHHLNTGQVQYGFWKNDFCVNASMKDSYRRQSALRPTPYPIPKFELVYTSNDFTCPLLPAEPFFPNGGNIIRQSHKENDRSN